MTGHRHAFHAGNRLAAEHPFHGAVGGDLSGVGAFRLHESRARLHQKFDIAQQTEDILIGTVLGVPVNPPPFDWIAVEPDRQRVFTRFQRIGDVERIVPRIFAGVDRQHHHFGIRQVGRIERALDPHALEVLEFHHLLDRLAPGVGLARTVFQHPLMPLARTGLGADPFAVQVDLGAVGQVADAQVDFFARLRSEIEILLVQIVAAGLIRHRRLRHGHAFRRFQRFAGTGERGVGELVVLPGDVANKALLKLAVQAHGGDERIGVQRLSRNQPVVFAPVELAQFRVIAPVVLFTVARILLLRVIGGVLHQSGAVDADLGLSFGFAADIMQENIQMVAVRLQPLRRQGVEIETVGPPSRFHRRLLLHKQPGRPEPGRFGKGSGDPQDRPIHLRVNFKITAGQIFGEIEFPKIDMQIIILVGPVGEVDFNHTVVHLRLESAGIRTVIRRFELQILFLKDLRCPQAGSSQSKRHAG